MENREELQKTLYNTWIDNDRNCILISGTGSGKGKVFIEMAVTYLNENPTAKVVIAVPTIRLKTVMIPDEFKKWGYYDYLKRIEIHCYDTLRSISGNSYDLVICDEVDKIVTPARMKFLINNKIKHFAGFTATLPKEKETIMSSIFNYKVKFRYSTEQASNAGIINKSRNIVIEYELDDTNKQAYQFNVTKGGKTINFYKSEYEYHKYLEDKFFKAKEQLIEMGFTTLGTNIYQYLNSNHIDKSIKTIMWSYENAMRKRKDLLLSLQTSAKLAIKIINLLRNNPEKLNMPNQHYKFLVFSELTSHIDNICKFTVHSNKCQSKKENNILCQSIIEKFNIGEINVLGSCQSLNVGENLVGANVAIFASYFSSEVNSQQKGGRCKRLDNNDLAYNIFLVPKGTQMETWHNNATVYLDRNSFEIINYKTLIND